MTDRHKGILYMVCGSFFLALMATFVKLSGEMPVVEKLFFRSIVGAVVSGYLLYRKGEGFGGHNRKVLFLRALFGCVALVFNFIAIDRLPLANAVILNQLSPFFTIIFAYLLLKERMVKQQWYAIGIALIGVVLIVKPGPGYTLFPAIAGLLSAILAAVAYVIVRFLRKSDNPQTIVFYFTTFTCLATFPFMVAGQYVTPSPLQLATLFAVGVAATSGQFLLTNAYRYCEAGDLSIYSYVYALFAMILGFLLWREVPGTLGFVGVLLVLAGAYLNWLSMREREPEKFEVEEGKE